MPHWHRWRKTTFLRMKGAGGELQPHYCLGRQPVVELDRLFASGGFLSQGIFLCSAIGEKQRITLRVNPTRSCSTAALLPALSQSGCFGFAQRWWSRPTRYPLDCDPMAVSWLLLGANSVQRKLQRHPEVRFSAEHRLGMAPHYHSMPSSTRSPGTTPSALSASDPHTARLSLLGKSPSVADPTSG
jgi:hypothetical protein